MALGTRLEHLNSDFFPFPLFKCVSSGLPFVYVCESLDWTIKDSLPYFLYMHLYALQT